ncbi:NAD-dependent epimerase/dehydratase family protein [Roseibium denhamense]|uniref:NAD(P)H-binding protein n=1 Tax=Roseibium denhamense TaxID=76305 RepID=UPI0012BBA40F|nr:NAD(P)H-binding protein [Roseibium denhamense]MTI06460.1 NAD-dependent epimerase/dehydratase family protein [Roseibium denhamense]
MFGGTGTIGQAVLSELSARGHQVTCVGRPRSAQPDAAMPPGTKLLPADISDEEILRNQIFNSEPFDAVISCLASRTGTPADAWAIDYKANSTLLKIAKDVGVPQFILLSAICVQKPKLEFQKAKLAFEAELTTSGLTYSIIRPTAYFKSLSGQLNRLKAGKPFLVFGNGRLTACKPISNRDLAAFISDCLIKPALQDRILPIGGPGDALTPLDQGELLFEKLKLAPKFRQVPPKLLTTIANGLSLGGYLVPSLKAKAELARIGHYYATESMLVWDEKTRRYDANATQAYGTETLSDHYERLVSGEIADERRDHAVF